MPIEQQIGAAEARWARSPKVLRSKLRFAKLFLISRLAQLVERKTLNLVVVGSSPTEGAYFFSCETILGEIWFLLIYQTEVNYKAALFFLNSRCP